MVALNEKRGNRLPVLLVARIRGAHFDGPDLIARGVGSETLAFRGSGVQGQTVQLAIHADEEFRVVGHEMLGELVDLGLIIQLRLGARPPQTIAHTREIKRNDVRPCHRGPPP